MLAKIGRLELLSRLYRRVIIGPVVKREAVDQGKAISALGVGQIEEAIERRWIRMVGLTGREHNLMRRIVSSSRLDAGEAEALALAGSRQLRLIVDDKEARGFARAFGMNYVGTAGVALEAFLQHEIGFDELDRTLAEMSNVMWLSSAVVAAIMRKARELE